MNIVQINFDDGSVRDCVKLADCKKLVDNIDTFSTYITSGRIPSIKVGASRFIELSIFDSWLEKRKNRLSAKPEFKGYN